jgi:sialidase-1
MTRAVWWCGSIALCRILAGAEGNFGKQEVLFSSGEASYFCFRIPALVTAGRGSVVAFAEARKTDCSDSDAIDLVMKRTDDGGKTWSDLRPADRCSVATFL